MNMAASGVLDDEKQRLIKHCEKYLKDDYRFACLPGSTQPVKRQTRTLDYEQEAPRDAGNPPDTEKTVRISTVESKLMQSLLVGNPRPIFVTGDTATGDGGSGKSQFTRALAFNVAEKAIHAFNAGNISLIPVRYELRKLWPNESLFQEVAEECPRLQLEKYAKSGQMLFILDGLDEMRSDTISTFDKKLKEFLKKTGNSPIVIAGREASMQVEWSRQLNITKERTYRLEPLSIDQVKQYIRDYFAKDKTKADQFLHSLDAASRAIIPLLRQPFMLAMACLAVEGNNIALPEDAITFMEQGLIERLHRRGPTCKLPKSKRLTIEPEVAFEHLRRLAAFACERNFRFCCTDKYFRQHFSAADFATKLLDNIAAASGILTVQGEGRAAQYSFTNYTVAEYLAGSYIALNGPVNFSNDWFDQQICPGRAAGSVAEPGSPEALNAALAFYGRYIWSDLKRNTLKWITATWWASGIEGEKIAERAGKWLLKHLPVDGKPGLDDCRLTLLYRFIDLAAACPESTAVRMPFLLDFLRVVPPVRYAGFDCNGSTVEDTEIAKLPWHCLREKYAVAIRQSGDIHSDFSNDGTIDGVIAMASDHPEFLQIEARRWNSCLGESWIRAAEIETIAEKLALVVPDEQELLDSSAQSIYRKLLAVDLPLDDFPNVARGLKWVTGNDPHWSHKLSESVFHKSINPDISDGDLASLARLFGELAPDDESQLQELSQLVKSRLNNPQLSGELVAELAEALVWVAGDDGNYWTDALEAIYERLDDQSIRAGNIYSLLDSFKWIATGNAELRREGARMLRSLLARTGTDMRRICYLAETLAKTATEDSLYRDEAITIAGEKLMGPDIDRAEAQQLADALEKLAGTNSVFKAKAATILAQKLVEPGLHISAISSLARSIMAVAHDDSAKKKLARSVFFDRLKIIKSEGLEDDEVLYFCFDMRTVFGSEPHCPQLIRDILNRTIQNMEPDSVAQIWAFSALIAMSPGEPSVAAMILGTYSASLLDEWSNYSVITGPFTLLQQQLRRIQDHAPRCWPRPKLVNGKLVEGVGIYPIDPPTPRSQSALMNPASGELPTAPEDPLRPAFLLALREQLVPGLDPTLLPRAWIYEGDNLEEMAAALLKAGNTENRNHWLVMQFLFKALTIAEAHQLAEAERLASIEKHLKPGRKRPAMNHTPAFAGRQDLYLQVSAARKKAPGGDKIRFGFELFKDAEKALRDRLDQDFGPTAAAAFRDLVARLELPL